MSLKKKHEDSYEMLNFLSKALESYRNKYTKISDQALANKIGVSVYFLSKFNSQKINDLDLAKIDILNLWNLIIFFKDRDVMDLDTKNEFKEKMEKFFALEFKFPRSFEIKKSENRDLLETTDSKEKDDSVLVCEDLDSWIIYSLWVSDQKGDLSLTVEYLNEIFGNRTQEILNRLENEGMIAMEGNKVRGLFKKYALTDWTFRNFLNEIPLRFFNPNDKGKGRMSSGFFIGTLNARGLAKLYTLTARNFKEIFEIFRNKDYGGKIPIAYCSFMNAMIRKIHQEDVPKTKQATKKKRKKE